MGRIERIEPAISHFDVLLRQHLLLAVVDVDGALLGKDVQTIFYRAYIIKVQVPQFGQDCLEAVARGVIFHHAKFRRDGIGNAIGSHCKVGKRDIGLREDVSLLDLFVTDAQYRVLAPDRHPEFPVVVLECLRIVLHLAREFQFACHNAIVLKQDFAGRMSRRINLARSAVEEVVRVLAKGTAVLPGDILGERVGGIVEYLHARVGRYIEVSVAILDQRSHEVVCQRMAVGGTVGIGDEACAIVAHQAVLGGYPHKTVMVLEDVVGHRTGQFFVRRQEPVRLRMARQAGQHHGNHERK